MRGFIVLVVLTAMGLGLNRAATGEPGGPPPRVPECDRGDYPDAVNEALYKEVRAAVVKRVPVVRWVKGCE